MGQDVLMEEAEEAEIALNQGRQTPKGRRESQEEGLPGRRHV